MNPIEKVLDQRQSTHGTFAENAEFSQDVKRMMRGERNWDDSLNNDMRETLDYIVMKMTRILNGNAHEPDHWLDIAGYATLVHKRLVDDVSAGNEDKKKEDEAENTGGTADAIGFLPLVVEVGPIHWDDVIMKGSNEGWLKDVKVEPFYG